MKFVIFNISGNDINVPPPTLTNNNPNLTPLGPNEEDDGQYREDPSIYYKDQKYNKKPIPATNFRLNSIEQQQKQPPLRAYNPPAPQSFAPSPPQYPAYQPPQQRSYQQPYYQSPSPNPYNGVNVPNQHHPALKNIDIWSGSYSISYTGR